MEKTEKKGGFFEQTQGKINPVVVKYYYGPRMARSDGSFDYLVRVMKAHVIMLGEQGIIPMDAAGKLLGVMEGWTDFQPELDPSLEDLYINLEHLITQAVGEDICSYLPAARSRNDVEAAMWRMELRERLFILAEGAAGPGGGDHRLDLPRLHLSPAGHAHHHGIPSGRHRRPAAA